MRISAKAASGALVARLTAQARRLAEAHAEARARMRRGDASRWREARLLWPLFGREQ